MNKVYLDSARLLAQVAPFVVVDNTFALKGGTAINLFIRDMPRLSVDLDLIFTDHTVPRDQALRCISDILSQSAARLRQLGFQTHAPATADSNETKLLVRRGAIEVKIEANFVLRGTVLPVRRQSLTPNAQEALLADIEIPVASLEDVYGGKLRRWTASTPAICLMSSSSSRTRVSLPAYAGPSLSILRAIIGRCTRSCFPRYATSGGSLSTILSA